ncbi:unnamed protein product, partial [Rotaria sordida]
MFRVFVRRNSTYAHVYRLSIEHPEQFWSEQAQKIFWFKRWKKVYDKNNLIRPLWFHDGHLNMTYNCLDRHISKHGNQTAIIHDSAMTGKVAYVTYKELLQQVKTLANVLNKKYNVKKGDVVLIYMPMIPEAIVAMLACARIGAIHNLVFGGFSANELSVRIKHSEPKLLISANVGFEPQRTINYKTIVDEAIKKSGISNSALKCIIFNRSEGKSADLISERDRDWKDVMDSARDYSDCEPVESNHPLYLLYTSGTTGTPKAIVRPTDVGLRTEDGFIEVSSRADDVLNVAGHRLSSGHIEQAIIESGKVSECAVIGLKDDIKGQQPFAFIVLNKNEENTDPTEIEKAIVTTVRQEIGPVAGFKKFICVKRLPKTRSGKTARNTLTALLDGKSFRIPSTIEDATVYDDLRKELSQAGYKNLG